MIFLLHYMWPENNKDSAKPNQNCHKLKFGISGLFRGMFEQKTTNFLFEKILDSVCFIVVLCRFLILENIWKQKFYKKMHRM